MTECQICNAKLVTDGLSSGQQIRCANCRSLSRFGKVETIATDRLAWRSFWLGISSILLLTITGIPAIYYGIRSLLRMRFIRPKRSDRAAAIIGTTLGGCFGVFIGFIAVCSLIVGLISFLTSSETEIDSEVVQLCSQYFEFSSPHVNPIKATGSMNGQFLFDFADERDSDDCSLSVRLAFVRTSLQPNDAIMRQQLRRKRLGKQEFGTIHVSEFLDWQFGGKPIRVKKSIYSRIVNPDSDSESPEETHHHYWGYVQGKNGLYGMTVLFEPGSHELSQSEVKAIFASTQFKDGSER